MLMVAAVRKLYRARNREERTKRDEQNWIEMTSYPTIRSLLERCPINGDIEEWANLNKRHIYEGKYKNKGPYKRIIPTHPSFKLPPAFLCGLTPRQERITVRWYMNTLPMRTEEERGRNTALKALLEANSLSDDDANKLEDIIDAFIQ